MTDVTELVEKATAKGTFSVLGTIKGNGYPEDHVTVYRDVSAAYLIKHLETQAADEEDPEKVNEIDEKITELIEKIKASALTFHLRGFPPKVTKAINAEAKVKFEVEDTSDGEPAEWCNMKYIAESIQKVVDAEGNEDTHHWSVDEVFALQGELPESEFNKIAGLMATLAFGSAYFEGIVNADFS